MSKPKTKIALIDACVNRFDELNTFIDQIPDGKINNEFAKGSMNRNIRDVLAHLYHWQMLFLSWYESGMKQSKVAMPAEGYSWKETPALNLFIFNKYQNKVLRELRKKLALTHQKILDIMYRHTNEELFEKKKFPWTGTTSLAVYLIGATSAHYTWALKLIKKQWLV